MKEPQCMNVCPIGAITWQQKEAVLPSIINAVLAVAPVLRHAVDDGHRKYRK